MNILFKIFTLYLERETAMRKEDRNNILISGRSHGNVQPLHDEGALCLGVDVGSVSSDIVVLDSAGKIIYKQYKRTLGRPIETFQTQLEKLKHAFDLSALETVAATGSAGRTIAKIINSAFINEVAAQAKAVSCLYPEFSEASVIEMGGQDSKLIFLTKENGRIRTKDFALNTVCAAGTGSFLDQQAQRLGIDIENEFGQMAIESKSVPRMAGRCSVFAKSDMIHLQQQATPMCDILAGLCLALARNLKSNLGCGRTFTKPIVFTGGVAANIGVRWALEQVFHLEKGQLIIPQDHFYTGAIGAVLVALERPIKNEVSFEKIDEYLKNHGSSLKRAPRRAPLNKPTLPPPASKVHSEILENSDTAVDAYLGIDVGSISTNVVVMDEQRRVLAKAYLMTAGNPLEAVRNGLDIVGKEIAQKVNILGAATTGSGRYLTGDFIGADTVINEITAQAAGAAIVNPKVDTIFEIGGQDSKYISLSNGVVVDFEMNHACAAGTGSFLEEQAQRLGISIKDEFANLAFESKAPIKLGERCTVFMESDLLSYQQQGAETPDLVAGLSYSIVSNYLNRVVGRRKIGSNICFQGGTAFNKAVWAAFEKVTGKQIMVPDHHEVTGALGAASIAQEHMQKIEAGKSKYIQSKFRGFENLVTVKYSVESFTCEHCANDCEIKKVQLPGSEPLYYGSRCDRYNLKKKTLSDSGFKAFEFRNKKLLDCAGVHKRKEQPKLTSTTIGIPRSLVFWQQLPLFSKFFKELGFEVVLSENTDKAIIRKGVELVTAQTCFPVKVAFGHVAELINKKCDYVFIPSIVTMNKTYENNKHNQLCPYVQSFVYQVKAAFSDKLENTEILTQSMRFGEGDKLYKQSFIKLGKKLGISKNKILKALDISIKAQKEFDAGLVEKGNEILNKIEPGKKLFVLVSRPYNGCDTGLNLQLPKKLAQHGVDAIPMDMLDLEKAPLSDEFLHSQTYWSYGQKILRAAEIIKNDDRLFAIYLSNFSCGPDSFLLSFFKDIMGDKPCLQLELDEHSADAGVITRLEAFLESLKHYKSSTDSQQKEQTSWLARLSKERTLYVPYMGNCAEGMAACFRAYGQPSKVMPKADEETLMRGRKFTNGKECLPCAITTGDMLTVIENNDPEKIAFFMPGGSGPCRFGMYNCLHRLVLKQAKALNIPVISPNQDDSFYSHFQQSIDSSVTLSFMKDVWASMVGIDLLNKLIIRLRPFAKDRDLAQWVYEESLARFIKAIERKTTVAQKAKVTAQIADAFSKIELDHTAVKPRIGVVGEIYVRTHEFANSDIIKRLENLGAACDLASLAEWVYYTNVNRMRMAKRRGNMKHWFSNLTQQFFQRRMEKQIAKPLEEKFGPLAEGPIEHTLELAKPYISDSFEGEAVLSVGKILEYYHQGFGGVINVMPFTCMPSTIVSTQTMRLSKDCGNMPILNISFDGQEDPTLTTRLEAFVEQIRQRQTSSVRELINV